MAEFVTLAGRVASKDADGFASVSQPSWAAFTGRRGEVRAGGRRVSRWSVLHEVGGKVFLRQSPDLIDR